MAAAHTRAPDFFQGGVKFVAPIFNGQFFSKKKKKSKFFSKKIQKHFFLCFFEKK
jgi:hypothetical protein